MSQKKLLRFGMCVKTTFKFYKRLRRKFGIKFLDPKSDIFLDNGLQRSIRFVYTLYPVPEIWILSMYFKIKLKISIFLV